MSFEAWEWLCRFRSIYDYSGSMVMKVDNNNGNERVLKWP